MIQIGAVIHGRYSRSRKLEKDFQKEFGKQEIPLICGFSTLEKNAGGWAEEFIQLRCTHIIVAGGDGSLHQVVTALMQIEEPENRPVLVVFPIGSGNDFARMTGSTADINRISSSLKRNTVSAVDVGKIERVEDGKIIVSHFINIADAGLGGEVARYLHQAPRWAGPYLMYQWSILRTLITYKPVKISVKIDSFTYDGLALNLVVANAAFFGGALHIAPGASINDGLLDIVLLGEFTIWDYLRFLPGIKKGRRIVHPNAFYLKAAVCEIQATEAVIEADGEFVGKSPIRFTVVPQAVKFLF